MEWVVGDGRGGRGRGRVWRRLEGGMREFGEERFEGRRLLPSVVVEG